MGNGSAFPPFEVALLARGYVSSLRLAAEHGIATIAFPPIRCGVSRHPVHQGVTVSVHGILAFLAQNALPGKVIFACFDRSVHATISRRCEGGTLSEPMPEPS
jgi:O-acetyl-ADP-ribose deacetylase (regulator of RNase III)